MAASTGFLPEGFRVFSFAGIALAFGIFFFLVVLNFIWSIIHSLYFHPLSHIPGPFFSRATKLPIFLHVIRGDLASYIQDAHEKYGAAVRVAPEEISFISGETAWQDIYGFRTGKNKTPPYLKDGKWYTKLPNTAPSILIADEADHSRMRRNLSHAFSDKAIKEQEPLVQGLVDLLVNRLHEQVEENNPTVDIMRWYNYTTFDIITDLTFGEPLYCLRDKDYHPWVVMIAASMKINTIKARTKQFAAFVYIDMLMGLFIDKKALENKRMEFYGLISAKVSKRIAEGTQRPDFISHILRNEEKAELALTKPELDSNALILMVGGSETTATVLSGFTYLLLRHPLVYEKVVGEIRGRFTKLADITFEKVSQLEYLVATLQESMRVYPAVPTGFPRAVPAGGDTVSGVYVSEGTSVYMSQHAANHSKRNWTDPDTFVPERWLGDAKYKDDNRAVVHPFSFGPRNCLGKNLAYAEMRLIAAKVLFSFDLELSDESKDWLKNNKVFGLWEKPPLMVKLRPVKR